MTAKSEYHSLTLNSETGSTCSSETRPTSACPEWPWPADLAPGSRWSQKQLQKQIKEVKEGADEEKEEEKKAMSTRVRPMPGVGVEGATEGLPKNPDIWLARFSLIDIYERIEHSPFFRPHRLWGN